MVVVAVPVGPILFLLVRAAILEFSMIAMRFFLPIVVINHFTAVPGVGVAIPRVVLPRMLGATRKDQRGSQNSCQQIRSGVLEYRSHEVPPSPK
jgi:hypothetical protein